MMLHIFRKDARRLWPAVLVSWLMLAVLTNADRWRADRIPSALEGWTTLLLSLAWACVAALAVQQESLVGDRNFWTTRPYRWPSLLGAKLLFTIAAIHLPSLLADMFVLSARGFSPATYLGNLLWKQLLLFGVLTLPVMALAAILPNFTHFVLAVFAIAAGLAVLNGGFQRYWPEPDPLAVRHALVRLVLAAAAVAVLVVQYARRRAAAGRVVAISTGLLAAAIWTSLPVQVAYAMRPGVAGEAPRIVMGTVASPELLRYFSRSAQSEVILPVVVDGGSEGKYFYVENLELEVVTSDGFRIRSATLSPNRPFEKISMYGYLMTDPVGLVLRFSTPAWQRVRNGRVTVRGTAGMRFYRLGDMVVIPAIGGSGEVPGVGKCATAVVDDRFSDSLLKVLCESPRAQSGARVAVLNRKTAGRWRERLNSSTTFSPGPRETWLSPLNRGQFYFRLAPEGVTNPEQQYLVPAASLAESQVAITPEIVTGHSLVHFEFRDVALTDWSRNR